MQYTRDGGIVPSHIRAAPQPGGEEHYRQFGLVRASVQRAVYPDDPDNLTGRLEYVVTVKGQDYPGVIDLHGPGGIFQTHTRVRRGAKYALKGVITESTFEEEKDGEAVFVLFTEGDGDIPVIVGGDQHPLLENLNSNWTKPSRADGEFDCYEYNGLQFKVDKDGTYTIRVVGITENPLVPGAPKPAKDSVFTLTQDGDLSYVSTDGPKVEVKREDDSVLVETDNGEKLSISKADGILLSTPDDGGTSISMKAGKIEITTAEGIQVTTAAAYILEGSGGARLKLNAGKVGLGTSSVELLDLVDKLMAETKKAADESKKACDQSALIIVPTSVGPSGVPTNAAAFTASGAIFGVISAAVAALKTQLGTIKGGV